MLKSLKKWNAKEQLPTLVTRRNAFNDPLDVLDTQYHIYIIYLYMVQWIIWVLLHQTVY